MDHPQGPKRTKGRALKFAVSGALLLTPAIGCDNNTPEYEPPTINVPPEPPPEPVPNPTAPDPTTMQEPVPNPTAPDPAEPAPE